MRIKAKTRHCSKKTRISLPKQKRQQQTTPRWSRFLLAQAVTPKISHTPLRKTWNFDGNTYTAVPGGLKDTPIYILEGMEWKENVCTLTLNSCGIWRDGAFWIPTDEDLEKLKSGISEAYGSWLKPIAKERISFRFGHDGPVFLSHTLVQ